MGRYEYISQHIRVYQHEYKMICAGKMSVDKLPKDCIQGMLYHFLLQFIDYGSLQAQIDEQIESVDEMVELYHFESYLGIMSSADKEMYGEENLKMRI
ncbi:MAG: hypothetical protein ACERKN_10880 [Velocimicrobium sp.]